MRYNTIHTLPHPHKTKEEEAGRWGAFTIPYRKYRYCTRASNPSPSPTNQEKKKKGRRKKKKENTIRNPQPRTSAVSKIPEADHSPERNLSNFRNLTIQCLPFAPRCAVIPVI